MNNLYQIAIDPNVPLEDRYAAIRIMKVMNRREWRRVHRKLKKEA